MRVRFRFAKLGKIRFTSQRDVARMWERALRRAGLPLAYTGGILPPAATQLRAGAAHRVRVPGRVPRRGHRRRRPEAAAVEVAALPACYRSAARAASTWRRRRGRAGDRLAPAAGHVVLVGDGDRRRVPCRLGGAVGAAARLPTSVPITRERKGREEHDDLRPSVLALAVCRATGTRGRNGRGGSVTVTAELATQPRGVRPVELVRGLVAVSGSAGEGRQARRAPAARRWESRCSTGHAERNSGSSATAPRGAPPTSGGRPGCRPRRARLERAS